LNSIYLAFEYITQFVFCVIRVVLKAKFVTWWIQKVADPSSTSKIGGLSGSIRPS